MDEATRKNFRTTAETLKHVPDLEKRKMLAKSHADEFKKMNSRFSHEKFYNACDIKPEEMHEAKDVERGMGNAKKVVKDVNPKTPSNTAKQLNAKAINVMESVDISDKGLGDTVSHVRYGIGKVIKCTEKPSITVKFENGVVKTFDKKSEQDLREGVKKK